MRHCLTAYRGPEPRRRAHLLQRAVDRLESRSAKIKRLTKNRPASPSPPTCSCVRQQGPRLRGGVDALYCTMRRPGISGAAEPDAARLLLLAIGPCAAGAAPRFVDSSIALRCHRGALKRSATYSDCHESSWARRRGAVARKLGRGGGWGTLFPRQACSSSTAPRSRCAPFRLCGPGLLGRSAGWPAADAWRRAIASCPRVDGPARPPPAGSAPTDTLELAGRCRPRRASRSACPLARRLLLAAYRYSPRRARLSTARFR